ncbi:MAG: FGGY family carbohydrate kinase, partial [Ktedonobacterales bacterium]
MRIAPRHAAPSIGLSRRHETCAWRHSQRREGMRMHAQSCTIGIDLGTTSVKAVAFDRDGHEIASASQPIALINKHEGEAEQDAFAVAT